MKTLLMAAVVLATGFTQVERGTRELQLPTDQKFLVQAIDCTIAEVKFADTAVDRASAPEVKELARKISAEHNQCLKMLMEQASAQKLAVVQGLTPQHKEIATKLAALEGKAFDQEYVRGVIERHEAAIASCKAQVRGGKVEEIKSYCTTALPRLEEHLAAARKVQAMIK